VLHTFGRAKAWHFLFAVDITDSCDCIGESSGGRALPDLGVLASDDPATVDLAALDLGEDNGHLGLRREAAQRFRATIAQTPLAPQAYTLQNI
jgi:uncharacterized Fe-S center protein